MGITFQIPGQQFKCDAIIGAIDTALAFVPEADPELVEELGEIAAICGEVEGVINQITGTGGGG